MAYARFFSWHEGQASRQAALQRKLAKRIEEDEASTQGDYYVVKQRRFPVCNLSKEYNRSMTTKVAVELPRGEWAWHKAREKKNGVGK